MRKLCALLAVAVLCALPVYAQESNQPPANQTTPEEKAILDKLEKEPLTLSESPQGAPDTTAWPGVTARFTTGQGNLKAGRENGHPFAVVQVREGICVDDVATKCYVTMLVEFSVRIDRETQTTDNIVRYSILSREGKKLGGFAWARSEATRTAFSYWVRRDQGWQRYEPGSPEYQAEHAFLSWLIQVLPGLDPQHKPSPGTKANDSKQ